MSPLFLAFWTNRKWQEAHGITERYDKKKCQFNCSKGKDSTNYSRVIGRNKSPGVIGNQLNLSDDQKWNERLITEQS